MVTQALALIVCSENPWSSDHYRDKPVLIIINEEDIQPLGQIHMVLSTMVPMWQIAMGRLRYIGL